MAEYYIGESDWAHHLIDYKGDQDTYACWLHKGQAYDFDVGEDDKSVDAELTVHDPTNTKVAFDYGSYDAGPHVDLTAAYTGWYILTVAGHNGDKGYYDLFTSFA